MTVKAIDLIDIPGITAFSTLRDAACPELPYSGFNTCHYTGDSPAHIAACRNELAQRLGISGEALVIPRQTHSANVVTISSTPAEVDNTDALVTCLRRTALCIHTADCVPVVLADTEAGVIGAAHSGWRGADQRIVERTIRAMQTLGASPARIIAAMGPCICADCFEVGEEVAQRFDRYGAVSRSRTKPHVDLPKVVAETMIECGVLPQHISPPPACPLCNSRDYFSARAAGINSGRTLTAIMLT